MPVSFSVIIPVYNGAATLARAIESVLGQSRPPSEVIVVDDGSTDETARIAAAYDRFIKYVRQPNAGVGAARNAGARIASAEWLAFLDADDWYYRDRLRWHAEWIERDAMLDFLTGDYEYRRADGGLIGRSMERTQSGRALLVKAKGGPQVVMEVTDFRAFVEDHFGDTHTLSVRRETFARLGGYPEGRAVCEDVHFLIRLCGQSTRVGVICEPLGVYLIHPKSATRSDPLRSQQLTVETLRSLPPLLRHASPQVRRGYRGRLRHARLNHAYALLRRGRRLEALAAVLPSVLESPGAAVLRDFASIARGCFQAME